MGMMSDVVCHTSGKGSTNLSLPTAPDNDKVGVLLRCKCDDGRPYITMNTFYMSIQLKEKNVKQIF
jgi:hypothetical protein